jgi:hypothetical protein
VCESELPSGFRLSAGPVFSLPQRPCGERDAPNLHSVQHFWLFSGCCLELTLEYQDGAGVLIKNRPDVVSEAEFSRFIAA